MRLFFVYIFFICCLGNSFAISVTTSNIDNAADSSYLPLHVGNAWFMEKDVSYYGVPISNNSYNIFFQILKDTIIGNQRYYKFDMSPDFWLRNEGNKILCYCNGSEYLFMDFDLPVGATFTRIYKTAPFQTVIAKVVTKTLNIFGSQVISKGYEYEDMITPTLGDYYSDYFSQGLGLVYKYNTSRGPMNLFRIDEYKIEQSLIINDSISHQFYQNPYSFSGYLNPIPQIVPDLQVRFNVTVEHSYNIFPLPGLTSFSSFIDSFHLDLQYIMGTDTISRLHRLKAEATDTPDKFVFLYPIDNGLFNQGYTKLLYRITVFDKSLIPSKIHIPETGYNSLKLYNKNIDFYPLSLNNKWLYAKKHLVGDGQWVISEYSSREVIKDTSIEGKKYFRIKDFDNSFHFERNDSITANTYRAVFDSAGVREILVDTIEVSPNDTVRTYRFTLDTNFVISCTDSTSIKYQSLNSEFNYLLRLNIGLEQLILPAAVSQFRLKSGYFFLGCITNGKAYGDTSLFNKKIDYYPLAVGNKWIYEKKRLAANGQWIHHSYVSKRVLKDTTMEGKKYFKIEDIDKSIRFEMADSVTGSTYRAVFNNGIINDVLLDTLIVNINDTVTTNRFAMDKKFKAAYYPDNKIKFQSISSFLSYELDSEVGLSKLILPLEYSTNDITYSYTFTAGVINGKAYGDTTLLDTEEDYKPISDFGIFQNYPNPFNPSTIISYDLPKASRIRLELYNVLGEKVALLVDDEMEAGRHNYELSSHRLNLPSGIYICRIIADNFVKSIKMNLIK